MKEYYLFQYNELKKIFNICFNNTNNLLNENHISIENNSFFNNNNYDEKINKILDITDNFTSYLEDIINQTFLIDCCDNETVENTNEELNIYNNSEQFCTKEKKKFDENYSKYNYNIVKLRTGIYYTKDLIEIIYSLFDDFNFNTIINIEKIKEYDVFLNDKNIFNIYNESNYDLIKINKESLNQIDEEFQYFIEDFKTKYTYKNDYLPFIEKFKEIISFNNENFNNNVTFINNNTIFYINELLKDFNKTLYEQIYLSNSYNYYNFNKTYFKYKFYYYN